MEIHKQAKRTWGKVFKKTAKNFAGVDWGKSAGLPTYESVKPKIDTRYKILKSLGKKELLKILQGKKRGIFDLSGLGKEEIISDILREEFRGKFVDQWSDEN